MNDRPCPICAGSVPAVLFAESTIDPDGLDQFAYSSRKLPEYMHLQLMSCPACDLVFASPAPDLQALSAAYVDAWFDSAVESTMAATTYATILKPYLARLPDRTAALDIGTGDGAFLLELLDARFQNVQGVEPSRAPIAAADLQVRSLIRQGIFAVADYVPATLSLVTCFQTIEHVRDPLELCRDIFTLLKPGGALCLVCHNRRAISARLLGRKSPIFDIEHMQLFSPQSLSRMLDASGFSRVEVFSIWNRYPLSYWVRLFPLPPPLKRGALTTLKATRLGRIPFALPPGNLAAVAFRS